MSGFGHKLGRVGGSGRGLGHPSRPEYRQGKTLGTDYRHWFRAKFFQQYRLFFRFHSASKVIVNASLNDDRILRAHESADDAYRVFQKMLDSGNPPDDWVSLVRAARTPGGDQSSP